MTIVASAVVVTLPHATQFDYWQDHLFRQKYFFLDDDVAVPIVYFHVDIASGAIYSYATTNLVPLVL